MSTIFITMIMASILPLSPIALVYGQSEFETYSDPILGISIDHPKGWEVVSEPDGVIFQNPTNDLSIGKIAEFSVTVNDLDAGTALDEYVRQILSGDREYDLAVISTNETMISGNNSAQKVLYTLGQEEDFGEVSKVMVYSTVANNTGYTVSFYVTPEADFQNYIPTMQKMIDSFKIL